MNEHRFFGRERLVGRLSELWGKSVSSFVTCRGRRRVGKSTLIERFAERSGARFLKIEGVKLFRRHRPVRKPPRPLIWIPESQDNP